MRYLKFTFVTLIFILIAGFYTSTEAQSRYSNTELGVILGEPTGLSLKAWQSYSTAFDVALAWSFSGQDQIHLHADYLWHSWLDVQNGSMALYYGLGARALLSDDSQIGARIPIGLQFIIPNSRLGLFFEVAPTLNLIPDTDMDVSGGLGLRFFL